MDRDTVGVYVVDIAEVWAAGARAESEVYAEMHQRVASLGGSPKAVALAEVVSTMGRLFADVPATPEPVAPEPVPTWLADRLVKTVGLSPDEVAAMTAEQAAARMDAFWSGRAE